MAFRRRSATPTRVNERVDGPPVVEEDRYIPPRRPPLPEIWPWLLLLLLLVVGGLVAAFFLTRDKDHNKSSPAAVTVPALVGLKQDEAVARLNERGLVPQLSSRPSKFPAQTVFAQDPGAGTQLDRGSHVSLTVSAAAVTPVPGVVGLKTPQAVARLKSAGLRSQVTSVPAKAAAGVVVAESPQQGTRVARGSTVSLNISKGQATVPDVVGQPVSSAKAAAPRGRARFPDPVRLVPATDRTGGCAKAHNGQSAAQGIEGAALGLNRAHHEDRVRSGRGRPGPAKRDDHAPKCRFPGSGDHGAGPGSKPDRHRRRRATGRRQSGAEGLDRDDLRRLGLSPTVRSSDPRARRAAVRGARRASRARRPRSAPRTAPGSRRRGSGRPRGACRSPRQSGPRTRRASRSRSRRG